MSTIIPGAEIGPATLMAETRHDTVTWKLFMRPSDGSFFYRAYLWSKIKPGFGMYKEANVADMNEQLAGIWGGAMAEDQIEKYGEIVDPSHAAKLMIDGFIAFRNQLRARGFSA